MNIIKLNNENINHLENFIKNDLPITFRYFDKRNIDVIKNHIITIILEIDNQDIGYAHIDFDDGKYWFGICLLLEYQGKGYGKKMMEFTFNDEKVKNIREIYLTVDKININAIQLYKKFNFTFVDEKEYHYLMRKIN